MIWVARRSLGESLRKREDVRLQPGLLEPGHKRRGIWNGVVFDEVFIVNGRYPNESAGGDYRRAANLGRWHTDASSSDSNVSVICVHDCWLARDRHSSYALLHGQ